MINGRNKSVITLNKIAYLFTSLLPGGAPAMGAVVELLADSLIAAAWISEKVAFEESGILCILSFAANNLVRSSAVRVQGMASRRRVPPKTGRGPLRKRAARQRARALGPKRLGSAP